MPWPTASAELAKFLGKDRPQVRFERYTGQESRAERDAILADPPDVLLTNDVMLALMLTRPRERSSLIRSAGNLSFLVLDELHTYRGRQGADVAMLIRRLRSAVGAAQLQRVGTSATLARPVPRAQQRAEVAALASRLFGTPRWPPSACSRIEECHRRVGYRVQAGIIEWRPGEGRHRAPTRSAATPRRAG